jgi:hypothetical protein
MGNLTKPPANILELPLAERAEMALKAAVEKVVESHVREPTPIFQQWKAVNVPSVPVFLAGYRKVITGNPENPKVRVADNPPKCLSARRLLHQ